MRCAFSWTDARAARQMRRLSDIFAEAAGSCTDVSRLGNLLEDATRELGFHFYALLDHAGLARPSAGVLRIDNYPEDWAAEFFSHGYAADDPVHFASRRTNIAFAWSELGRLIKLERRHSWILARSRHFGLGPGLTMPANVPGEPSASCSFAVRAGSELPPGPLHSAALIGAHALCAARRLRHRATRPHLSRREIQCLRLVAFGKTDWEIAQILRLSPHTASQYVKRARAAYDTISRTQAVVSALRDGWIGFEDSIPPDWGMG